ISDFFVFEDTLRNGVYVAIGDVNGDGNGDLIFGAGPGGGPRVLVVSGKKLLTDGAVAAIASPHANFFVRNTDSDRGGVRVAAKGRGLVPSRIPHSINSEQMVVFSTRSSRARARATVAPSSTRWS